MTARISSRVKSGCLAIRAKIQSECSSNGETLPPLRFGAALPVSLQRWHHRITELTPTLKISAISRRDAPLSTASTARSRKSVEYGLGIDLAPQANQFPQIRLGDSGWESLRFNADGKCSSYDAIADFAPISLVTRVEYFMFVPNSSPAHSLKEFVDYVRSRPGQLTMASPGTGSAPYLAEMLFLQMADMKMTHVPYRGAAPAFSDLIPGRVDCYFGSGTLLSYSRSGQVRVLASTGPTRNMATPDVPAIAKYVPGYEVVSSQALFVPAKTPRETVRKISADTNTVLADPAIRDKLAETGYVAGGSSPEELGKLLRSEIARWSALIKSVGITLD